MKSGSEQESNAKWEWFEIATHPVIAGICLVTNIASYFYIERRLEVNTRVANILKLDTAFKILLMTLAEIGFVQIIVFDQRDLDSCSLALLPFLASLTGSYMFPAATSIIR